MAEESNDKISPFIERAAPQLPQAEKEALSEDLRAYFAVLLRIYERQEAEGLLGPDSSDSDSGDTLRVA